MKLKKLQQKAKCIFDVCLSTHTKQKILLKIYIFRYIKKKKKNSERAKIAFVFHPIDVFCKLNFNLYLNLQNGAHVMWLNGEKKEKKKYFNNFWLHMYKL